MQTLYFKAQQKMRFSLPSTNARRLLPACEYCQARGNQIVEHTSDNGTMLGSDQKLGRTAKHLTDGGENAFVRMLLKGEVIKTF